MIQSLDPNTSAADPGLIALSESRLCRLESDVFVLPDLRPSTSQLTDGQRRQRKWFDYLAGHLAGGDSRAAVVLSVRPLQVAAYSSELDCAVVLGFPEWLVEEQKLVPGRRLLAVNAYARGGLPPQDVRLGPAHLGRWIDVFPLIAEFLTDDLSRPAARRTEIDEGEWRLAERYGRDYLRANGGRVRDGRPTRLLPS